MTARVIEARGDPVNWLRRLAMNNRTLAGLVLVLALFAKILIPSGFMPMATAHGLVIQVCTGTGPATMAVTITGQQTPGDDHKGGKADSPCAFSGLSVSSLAGADPILLALAILFATALVHQLGFARPAAEPSRLRPPLRGPPFN